MVGELGGERPCGACYEADSPVGMGAGAPPVYEPAESRDPLVAPGGANAAGGDRLDRQGKRVEAVDARTALSGALFGEPAGDARRLGNGAGGLGQQKDDPGAERGAMGAEMLLGEDQFVQVLGSEPAPA